MDKKLSWGPRQKRLRAKNNPKPGGGGFKAAEALRSKGNVGKTTGRFDASCQMKSKGSSGCPYFHGMTSLNTCTCLIPLSASQRVEVNRSNINQL